MDEEEIVVESENVAIQIADPETGEKVGELKVVWAPRFFGRWGRSTPRVVFEGYVAASARELFKFMLKVAGRYSPDCCRDG